MNFLQILSPEEVERQNTEMLIWVKGVLEGKSKIHGIYNFLQLLKMMDEDFKRELERAASK